jgi:hypothetical protein
MAIAPVDAMVEEVVVVVVVVLVPLSFWQEAKPKITASTNTHE